MSFAHWEKLLYGIERGECILFLGPELPVETTAAGPVQIPAQSLALHLADALDHRAPGGVEALPSDLAWIAQRFLAQEDELSLERELERWHLEWQDRVSPLHDDLATMPFRLVVTTALDPLMESALRRAGKEPAVERYHYRGRNEELLPEPAIDAPVLFHLYGHVNEPASVVLTEMQLLDFLAHLISRDPPLPNDLNEALTNGRLFLFLGFGLRQWYLRILFHVLRVLRPENRGFAIEGLEHRAGASGEPRDAAILFYRDNFKKMDLVSMAPTDFVRELRRRFIDSGAGARIAAAVPAKKRSPTVSTSPATTATTVFICHASEDKDRATQIHDALKRARLEPWLDKDALRGGDRWDDLIASTIKKVDYVVVVNSRALAAKSREASYVNKEINRALEAEELRLFGRFIVPVSIDDAPLLEPLQKYHAIDLRSPDGLSELVRAIKRHVGAA